jgi:hypothetical protein
MLKIGKKIEKQKTCFEKKTKFNFHFVGMKSIETFSKNDQVQKNVPLICTPCKIINFQKGKHRNEKSHPNKRKEKKRRKRNIFSKCF